MIPWLVTLALAGSAEAADRARWVVAVGAHVGDLGTERLRHAGSDALAFVDALVDLGGVPRDHAIFLQDPTVDELRGQLDRLQQLLADARLRGEAPEVVFFYSGHADDRGLTPSGQRLPWAELRTRIAGLDAELRVAVIDACASGSFLRGKGGVQQPGFLQDQGTLASGEVYLTSASADEAAQESDRLGGSYFTHHLVTGLRGAADANADLRVSLSEAYDYAYQQTVAGTELSWAGVQHPGYAIDLTGRSDVVLTDLRARTAALALDTRLGGTITVRDDSGRMVAEVDKPLGEPVLLALPPGTYTLRLWTPSQTYKARLQVPSGGATEVGSATFQPVASLERTRLRGARPLATWTTTHRGAFHLAPFVGSQGLRRDVRLAGFGFNVLGATHAQLTGFELGAGTVIGSDLVGVDWEGLFSFVRGRATGWQLGALTWSGADLRGVQWAGVLARTGGDASGWQIATVALADGRLHGVQWGLVTLSGAHSPAPGAGWQLAGVYARAAGSFDGVQMGLVTHADDLRGAQLGVVNVAKERTGLQLGLVNVSRGGRGESLGLVTWASNGYHAVDVWSGAYAPIGLSLKLGTKVLYTGFELGLDPLNGPLGVSAGLLLGAHVGKGRVFFDTDLGAIAPERMLRAEDPKYGIDLRWTGMLAVRVAGPVHVVLGPELGLGFAFDDRPLDLNEDEGFFLPTWSLYPTQGHPGPHAVWAGYRVGLRATF
ncbi:MAG: hypothetical protein H6732_06120 [Alphaproteobacteria bacterium]|nr:hypothetical protein [Alphaproteobacteria bacterium]